MPTYIREYDMAGPLKPEPIFIHIPKTGGTYVRNVLSPIIYLNHCLFESGGEANKFPKIVGYLGDTKRRRVAHIVGHPVFAAARNVWDWLVSYWGHAGGHNPKYNDPLHYDHGLANKGFDYFVRAIADRGPEVWPNKGLIHFAMWSSEGQFLPDYVLRTERLDFNLERFAKDEELTFTKKDPIRKNPNRKDFRSYYSDGLANLVHTTWEREINFFGFDFDHIFIVPKYIQSLWRISSKEKESIRYNYKTNCMWKQI